MTSLTPLPRQISSDEAYRRRMARYAENRRYYVGENRIRRRRRSAAPAPRNYTALFVDTVTAHMGAPRISWGDGADAAAHEEHYRQVLDEHDGELLEYEAETGCAVDGDACIKVTWDDVEKRVRLQLVDPSGIWAAGRPDDPLDLELVAQRYTLRLDDAPAMFGGRLVSSFGTRKKVTITEAWSATSWQVWLEQALMLNEANPYGFIPYVIYPNIRAPGTAWGAGDPERIRAQQDLIDDASNDTDQLAALLSNIVVISGADDGDVAVEPGAIWYLPEGARADVLDLLKGGALTQRLEYLSGLQSELHAIARIPKTALGEIGNAPSGLALQVQLGPLVRLVHRKRLTRSAALRKRARYIAALGSKFAGLPDVSAALPRVLWDDPIPSDRADDLANAEAELRIGRSVRAVLSSVGIEDPDAELAARRAEIAEGIAAPINPRTQGASPDGNRNAPATGV